MKDLNDTLILFKTLQLFFEKLKELKERLNNSKRNYNKLIRKKLIKS